MTGSQAMNSDPTPQIRSAHSVLDAQGFRSVLQRERALAERAELAFTVLVFELERTAKPVPPSRLLDVLSARIRATDVIGLRADGGMEVLLRYASVADAVHVAAQVCGELGEQSVRCTAYGYPPFEFGTRSTEVVREPAALPSAATAPSMEPAAPARRQTVPRSVPAATGA